MKARRILIIISSIILITALHACSSFKRKAIAKITPENKAIPADFGKNETVLLCKLQGNNNYDNQLKKHVTKQYTGKCEFVFNNDLKNSKYADTQKYRYLFDSDTIQEITTDYEVRAIRYVERVTVSNTCFIKDRLKGDIYNSPIKSNFVGKLIQAYMISLEKTRLNNQLKNE